jgi:hypothetical protein
MMYQDFQELRNHCWAEGVEPVGAAALLAPINRAEDELEPAVAASPAVFFAVIASVAAFFFATASSAPFFFITASSVAFSTAVVSIAAFSFVAASSVAFFTVVASTVAFFTAVVSSADFFAAAAFAVSFFVVALVATTVSSAAELPLDSPGVVAHTAANESGRGAVAAGRGVLAVDLPLLGALIRLCSRTSSSDDTSLSLWTTRTTFPFPLLKVEVEAAPPWPLAALVPRICMSQD